MKLKNRIKKIGAGVMASLCAISVIGGPVTTSSITANAALTTENSAFPPADEVIAQAATLLGSPYGWGYKGYSESQRKGYGEIYAADKCADGAGGNIIA